MEAEKANQPSSVILTWLLTSRPMKDQPLFSPPPKV